MNDVVSAAENSALPEDVLKVLESLGGLGNSNPDGRSILELYASKPGIVASIPSLINEKSDPKSNHRIVPPVMS